MRYLFEDYTLDTERRELRRGMETVPVTPQVFDLLQHLISNRERVISREGLIAAIWNGRIVSDAAVTTRLNVARRAIDDNGGEQRLIKTLARKGFRFVGDVREEPTPVAGAAADNLVRTPTPPHACPGKPSVAVLPFANMSGDLEQEYFAVGITDDIITELSRFSGLFVIARNSSFKYKGKSIDVRQIGRELGVRYVLVGSIRRSGKRVRIAAQLIEAVTGAHRWAERYDRKVEEVFAVQDDVARGIVTALVAHVNKAEIARTLLKPPATWQAHDYYLRAVDVFAGLWSSFRKEELYETRRLLKRALAIDPNYARAYAILSGVELCAYTNPLDGDHFNAAALDRAEEWARKAVQIDPKLPQARTSLGHVLVCRHQHEAAIAECERAIALNPNSVEWRFAWILVFAGEPERAVKVNELSMRLDPFYPPFAPACVGFGYYMLKRYADALPQLRESISRSPHFLGSHLVAAATYARLGQLEKARAEVNKILRIEPSFTIGARAKHFGIFKLRKDADHFFGGLRKAGLPE